MSDEMLFEKDLLLVNLSLHAHPSISTYQKIKAINLSQLNNIDSAGIAYLVQIKTKFPELMLINASVKLHVLAELYGVEYIFINNG